MIRRASLELLVRGLFGDDDAHDSRPPSANKNVTDAKSKRDTWPWTPPPPAPEFVLC